MAKNLSLAVIGSVLAGVAIVDAAVIALICAAIPPQPARSESENAPTDECAEVTSRPESEISLLDYAERVEELRHRPLEAEQFRDSLVGKKVRWEGTVIGARSAGTHEVLVMVRPGSARPTVDAHWVGIAFDSRFSEQLLSLQRDDRLRVRAVYKGGVAPTVLRGLDFQCVASLPRERPARGPG